MSVTTLQSPISTFLETEEKQSSVPSPFVVFPKKAEDTPMVTSKSGGTFCKEQGGEHQRSYARQVLSQFFHPALIILSHINNSTLAV